MDRRKGMAAREALADRTGPDAVDQLSEGTSIGARTDPAAEIARLRTLLRRERARGRAGHWTYDLARHLSLARRLRDAERMKERHHPGRIAPAKV